ncbi:hypothetical protein HHK36_020126 [Tetracentron sinense]|uniref:BEACH-type PH domain-containing protein n=1 Tax=Tetracentron sinense TaxID=13715 RepID=A0A834YR29_TETSI|nr:hypothetical protein HHK36_020126 [Tetracentron sinense]
MMQVWHAVGRDIKPFRKQYLDAILPPFVAILRRWCSLLAGIHDLTSFDGLSPLIVDDRALAADALPLESALAMISLGWAVAFASPPTALAMAMAMIAAGAETATPATTTQLRQAVETPNKSPVAPKDKASAKAAALAAARDLERNAKIGSGRGLSAAAIATCAQRHIDTKLVSGKDFSALSYKYVAVLVASFALERHMQRLEVFWKLDFMESSSRMRRCLRKNYKGSDHFGAAADYEDHLQMKHDQENVTFPSTASILVADAISMEEVTEDDDQTDTDNREGKTYVMEQSGDNQQRLPTTAEAPLRVSLESRDAQVSSDTDLIQNPSAVAPRYVPSELDERSILELSSSMVRPLRVIRGTFQITTKRINFIIVDHIADNAAEDGLDSSSEIRDQEKDRSWLMSSLHQMFGRR